MNDERKDRLPTIEEIKADWLPKKSTLTKIKESLVARHGHRR